MNLFEQFKANLESKEWIQAGERILLAVSGGLDSVALLRLFFEVRERFHLELRIVHVHHGIRGEEADADLEFVRMLAKQYDLSFYFRKVNAEKLAAEQKLSLEESARMLRYQAFEEILQETESHRCATAHTADDQAETIIDRLLRGSGITGLRGILGSRDIYIRPLLVFSRKEIEGYVSQQSLTYRQDSSNEDLRFRRNRIRKQLMPHLIKYYNPNLVKTLMRSGQIFEENETFLNAQAQEALKSLVSLHKKNEIILEIEGFLSYFKIVKKYILIQACEGLSIHRNHLTFNKLEQLLKVIEEKKIGKKVLITKDFELIVDHDGIVIKRRFRGFKNVTLHLLKNRTCEWQDLVLEWSIIENTGTLEFDNKRTIEFVDFDKTGKRLRLRTYLPGDRFIPLNLSGHKKVADYFSDQKIPHHLREITPILESTNGIVWVCGYAIDDRFKVSGTTRRILRLELNETSQ